MILWGLVSSSLVSAWPVGLNGLVGAELRITKKKARMMIVSIFCITTLLPYLGIGLLQWILEDM